MRYSKDTFLKRILSFSKSNFNIKKKYFQNSASRNLLNGSSCILYDIVIIFQQ